MKIKYLRPLLLSMALLPILFGCSEDFLEEKSDLSYVVPTQLTELQQLLDNNVQAMNTDPGLGDISADNIVVEDNALQGLSNIEINGYRWQEDLYEGDSPFEWSGAFTQILYANVVLDALENIDRQTDAPSWDNLQGSALFYRAYAYFNLARQFCAAYQPATAGATLGLPLRRSPDITAAIRRESLEATFAMIIEDLEAAEALMFNQPSLLTRPSRPAALALLSRVYLYMGDYERCLAYSNETLALHNALMDYQDYDPAAFRPFPRFNEETLFYSEMGLYMYCFSADAKIVSSLLDSYAEDDLRRDLFFEWEADGTASFKGNYTEDIEFFSGLATDEIYLNKAESEVRLGNAAAALETLNALLMTRFAPGTYEPFTVNDQAEVLAIILQERRKQLLNRGIRWADLKRLNLDAATATTITRVVYGESRQLVPGDPRYILPIPDVEIEMSGLEQNPR